MKPWYEIAIPNSWIRSGHIKESWFVVDIIDVIKSIAPPDFNDPKKFFANTYITRGLYNLLNMVQLKIRNEEGNGVIKLQSPFGGGKTHALISLFHYLKNGKKIAHFLPEGIYPLQAKIAVIGGTHLNPLEGQICKDFRIKTIWGSIIYQLGGIEGYNDFRNNDENLVSPGKTKLMTFFKENEPFLILLDEIVEYINKALAITINESNLGFQTLLFIQELCETIASLQKSVIVITIPKYQDEDFSNASNSVLDKLNRILGRLETIMTPIDRRELYQVITTRLLEKIENEELRDEIIFNYMETYNSLKNDLPEKVCNKEYIECMKNAFPFHPELIDILSINWTLIPSFQGIRGILRILARVLTELWLSKEELNLIQPSNVLLERSSIKNEFLDHIDPKFEKIIETDICGLKSKGNLIDIEFKEWKNLASGASRTIFLKSFPIDSDLKGINISEMYLYLLTPHMHPKLISDVISYLKKRLNHLHNKNGRFWFDQNSNLNHRIQDIKELLDDNLIEEETRLEIYKNIGNDFPSYIWPSTSREIPDNQDIKIIIVHPIINRHTLKNWMESKGNTFRYNRNTIIFALVHKSYLSDLGDLIKTKIALNELQNNMTVSIKGQNTLYSFEIEQRLKEITNSLPFAIKKLYSILFDGKNVIDLGFPNLKQNTLTEWYKNELYRREFVVAKLHHKKINDLFLSSKTYISLEVIIQQFFANIDFVKIKSEDVIRESIIQGVEEGEFGYIILKNNIIFPDNFFFQRSIDKSKVKFLKNEILIRKENAFLIVNHLEDKKNINGLLITDFINNFKVRNLNSIIRSEVSSRLPNDHSLSIEVQDIDPKYLKDFYQGVIRPLELKKAKISLKLQMNIITDEKISEDIIDNKITETITQLGLKMDKMDKNSTKNTFHIYKKDSKKSNLLK